MHNIIRVLLLASTVYAIDDQARLFSWSTNAEQARQINHQFYIESNGGNENYNNQYNQYSQNNTAAAATASNDGGGGGAGAYTVDELIDSILASNRQGRNLDGFDEVYSDPTVQNALQKGDDSQARNLIKEKLCTLGLMQCDGATGSDIDHKNAFLRPGELIYAQPPPNVPYRGGPPIRPPTKTIIYGAPRPMPPGYIKQQSFGPPRKVGYAPGPVYSSPSFIGSPPTGFGAGASFSGPSISGPIYHSKPPGPIIESPAPYKFDSHGGEHIISNEEFHALGLGGDAHVPVKAAINDGITGSGSSNSLNIHHHYHHIDGAAGGQHDSVKTPAVIVNNPIPVPVASAPLPLVTGKFNIFFEQRKIYTENFAIFILIH